MGYLIYHHESGGIVVEAVAVVGIRAIDWVDGAAFAVGREQGVWDFLDVSASLRDDGVDGGLPSV